MGWMEFIVALLEAGAWPIAAVTIVILLRKQLAEVLPALESIKAGPFEVGLREHKELAEKIERGRAALPPPEAPDELDQDEFRDLEVAGASGRGRIIEAWASLEKSQVNLLRQISGTSTPRWSSLQKTLSFLTPQQAELYFDLRRLRNSAAHDVVFALPENDISGVVETSRQLSALFRLHSAREGWISSTEALFSQCEALGPTIGVSTSRQEREERTDRNLGLQFEAPASLSLCRGERVLEMKPGDFEQNLLPPAYSGIQLYATGFDAPVEEIFYSEDNACLVIWTQAGELEPVTSEEVLGWVSEADA